MTDELRTTVGVNKLEVNNFYSPTSAFNYTNLEVKIYVV